MKAIICVLLTAVSLVRVERVYTGEPVWPLPPTNEWSTTQYDPVAHIWIYCNNFVDVWAWGDERAMKATVQPVEYPEKQEVELKFDPTLFWRRESPMADLEKAMALATAFPNRRLHLINVERSINEESGNTTQFRLWPHLGLLYVGTVADQEGWDVSLHDELVEGYVDLERVVRPGDVVGLSLVITGTERGIELARQAKRLGARYVIVGNDSAIFRADQILRLPDRPIDAVFTTNSLAAVRQFLHYVSSVELNRLNIHGVAIIPGVVNPSNERAAIRAERAMRAQLEARGQFDPQDVFVVPKLSLFRDRYWQKVWRNYRTIFGHKHADPERVQNSLALFAQGCTRTGTADICSYCTIAGVADIRTPTKEHLTDLLEAYRSFGINYVFNVTDSVLEMHRVAADLKSIGAFFPEGLMIYGRAWGLAHHPEFIDEWLSLTGGRLLVNVGMDSGDERILSRGVVKASQSGSRLDENCQAVRNIAAHGAHLHYSLIFGSPGETRETCEESLEFFEWTRAVLGKQLDQCETDVYWLNHGAPASRVFHDYGYACELASLAGKEISRETWEHRFHRHRDTLIVPEECEEAWYDCFTSITVEEARSYNAHVAAVMTYHEDAAPGRNFVFRPG